MVARYDRHRPDAGDQPGLAHSGLPRGGRRVELVPQGAGVVLHLGADGLHRFVPVGAARSGSQAAARRDTRRRAVPRHGIVRDARAGGGPPHLGALVGRRRVVPEGYRVRRSSSLAVFRHASYRAPRRRFGDRRIEQPCHPTDRARGQHQGAYRVTTRRRGRFKTTVRFVLNRRVAVYRQ